MNVPGRTPAAHQVAAAQNKVFKGCYVYVESGCDCRFWKSHMNVDAVKIIACNGWPEVVETVKRVKGENKVCIGIIDKDFRDYVDNYGELPDDVFVSDQHDLEMMIIKVEGIDRVVNDFDAEEHIKKFEENEKDSVLGVVFNITNRIGILKLINKRDCLNFKLKKKGKKTEYDLPGYERFLDKNGHYISDEKMINYLFDWSCDNKSFPTKSREEILTLYREEDINNYDSYQLSSGHDVTYIIAHLIWKHISKEKTDKEEIEKLLRVSFSADSFKKTRLYASLDQWGVNNGMKITK